MVEESPDPPLLPHAASGSAAASAAPCRTRRRLITSLCCFVDMSAPFLRRRPVPSDA